MFPIDWASSEGARHLAHQRARAWPHRVVRERPHLSGRGAELRGAAEDRRVGIHKWFASARDVGEAFCASTAPIFSSTSVGRVSATRKADLRAITPRAPSATASVTGRRAVGAIRRSPASHGLPLRRASSIHKLSQFASVTRPAPHRHAAQDGSRALHHHHRRRLGPREGQRQSARSRGGDLAPRPGQRHLGARRAVDRHDRPRRLAPERYPHPLGRPTRPLANPLYTSAGPDERRRVVPRPRGAQAHRAGQRGKQQSLAPLPQ